MSCQSRYMQRCEVGPVGGWCLGIAGCRRTKISSFHTSVIPAEQSSPVAYVRLTPIPHRSLLDATGAAVAAADAKVSSTYLPLSAASEQTLFRQFFS